MINSCVRVGSLGYETHCLFVPEPDSKLSEGLELTESLVLMPKGQGNKVKILVTNKTNRNISIPKSLYVGSLEAAELTQIDQVPEKIESLKVKERQRGNIKWDQQVDLDESTG
ncbi:hypothetical protein SNE40_002877 [Patella caerulea]|uniref:Uncharacterized protein n=1 Tax=Patella caerulea TaxID=87958 RepID=A0AAN8QEL8_PATCE